MKWFLIFLLLFFAGCTLMNRIDMYEYVRTGADFTEMEIDETVWQRAEDTDMWWDEEE